VAEEERRASEKLLERAPRKFASLRADEWQRLSVVLQRHRLDNFEGPRGDPDSGPPALEPSRGLLGPPPAPDPFA